MLSQYSQYAQQEPPPQPKHHMVQAILNDVTGELLEYWYLIKRREYKIIWQWALANELGCLAQGIRAFTETDTIKFIPKHTIPTSCTPMYEWIVVDYHPQKTEPHRS